MDTELVVTAVCVGLGATLVMDLWAVVINRVFKIPLSNYCMVGRWLRHMGDGTVRHASIAAAARKPAECVIGWIAHYLTGSLFALALVSLVPVWLHSPTLLPALIFGIVTVGFPFFIMHPSFGLGMAASKAPDPMQARLRSLMNHTVFGLGLYVSALLINYVI